MVLLAASILQCFNPDHCWDAVSDDSFLDLRKIAMVTDSIRHTLEFTLADSKDMNTETPVPRFQMDHQLRRPGYAYTSKEHTCEKPCQTYPPVNTNRLWRGRLDDFRATSIYFF